MTLAEEQLEALDFALEYLVDDPNDDRDSNLANSIRTIRAMINSSKHVIDPTKMIGFDLEKAREAVHILENFAFASGKITTGQIQDILWGARLLAGASTEIERLRAKVGKMEFLMRSTDDTCLACAIKLEVIDQQAARIQELEDALVEELAIQMAKKDGHDWCDLTDFPATVEYYQSEAAVILRAEGKIEPDADAKPHCWRIMEERKAALKRLYGLLVIRYKYSYPDETETLRAMLEEVEG